MSERGNYRPIHTVLLDEPVYLELAPAAKLVFLTLKIQLGPSGIGVIAAVNHALSEQTGYSPNDVADALTQLVAVGWIGSERNVFEVIGALDDEPSISVSNPNHRKGIVRHVGGLPKLPIVAKFKERYAQWFSPDDPAPDDAITKASPRLSNTHLQCVGKPIAIRENERRGSKDEQPVSQTEIKPFGISSLRERGASEARHAPWSKPKWQGKPGFQAHRGDALIIIGDLRSKREFFQAPAGGRYRIPKAEVDALSSAARRAIKAIGGISCIASVDDAKFSIVSGQFATAYASAKTAEVTETL